MAICITDGRHVKMPFGVADRDLLQYISHRKDEEKKLHYVLYKNATDERRPEISGVVRLDRRFNKYMKLIQSSCMRLNSSPLAIIRYTSSFGVS